jgi:hypothetical protein
MFFFTFESKNLFDVTADIRQEDSSKKSFQFESEMLLLLRDFDCLFTESKIWYVIEIYFIRSKGKALILFEIRTDIVCNKIMKAQHGHINFILKEMNKMKNVSFYKERDKHCILKSLCAIRNGTIFIKKTYR